MTEITEIAAWPEEAKRLYETSAPFRQAVDELNACFTAAREELSSEDYMRLLKWTVAYSEELK